MFNEEFMISSKKSQLGALIVLIAVTIIITFLLIFFLFGTNAIAKWKFSENKEIKYSMIQQQVISLEGYLSTPVNDASFEKSARMSDLIVLWDISTDKKQEYRDKISSKTAEIFGNYQKGILAKKENCYFLGIETPLHNIYSGDRNVGFFDNGISTSIYLPSKNNFVNVTIILNKNCIYQNEN